MDYGSAYLICPRTTSQVGCKSPLWASNLVITPTCLFTFGRVYSVLSMGRIHRTPHLAHVVLLSVISISHNSVKLSSLTIYQYIQYSVSACYELSMHPVSSEISTSRSDYYTCFCVCLVMFYFSFTLSYMLSTFQVRKHTCSISSRDVGLGSQHSDHA